MTVPSDAPATPDIRRAARAAAPLAAAAAVMGDTSGIAEAAPVDTRRWCAAMVPVYSGR